MYPKKITALKISQPFGDFFICELTANDLLHLTFSDPLRFKDESGNLVGSQRIIDDIRVKEIGDYIQTVEAAFPNSIILSANYDQDGNLSEDNKLRWQVKKISNPNVYELIIPTREKLASIIDGQHRLNGFLKAPESFRDFQLLCSIYLDLPNPFQAFLFATINFNQKKVDKSLAYEQFGFNLDDEPPIGWSPEKVAVFLTRKLNSDHQGKSPFFNHIILAPQDDELLFEKRAQDSEWAISTSTIVDSIMRLFSSNHKKDKYQLHKFPIADRKRQILREDGTPFRKQYLAGNDLVIYKAIINYFSAANNILFKKASQHSYIKKTIGVQGLFDFFKRISVDQLEQKRDISYDFYSPLIGEVENVDFSNDFFQASGLGRGRIRNTLLIANGLLDLANVNEEDVASYKRVLKIK